MITDWLWFLFSLRDQYWTRGYDDDSVSWHVNRFFFFSRIHWHTSKWRWQAAICLMRKKKVWNLRWLCKNRSKKQKQHALLTLGTYNVSRLYRHSPSHTLSSAYAIEKKNPLICNRMQLILFPKTRKNRKTIKNTDHESEYLRKIFLFFM